MADKTDRKRNIMCAECRIMDTGVPEGTLTKGLKNYVEGYGLLCDECAVTPFELKLPFKWLWLSTEKWSRPAT
jgi:hypothetical protein